MSKNNLTYVELNPNRCSDLLLKNCSDKTYQRIPAPFLLLEDSKLLAESFRALFASVDVGRKRGEWSHELTFLERGFVITPDWDFVVPTEFALSFFNTYKILSESTHNIYQDGREEGKSLLFGLNKGSLTMDDFNNNVQK